MIRQSVEFSLGFLVKVLSVLVLPLLSVLFQADNKSLSLELHGSDDE